MTAPLRPPRAKAARASIAVLVALAAAPRPALAQAWRPPPVGETVPPVAQAADLDEQLGRKLPLDLRLVEEHGRAVTLGELLADGHPLVLVPAYYRCPMLCDVVLRGLVNAVANLAADAEWAPGRRYTVATVSFDPADTPERAGRKQASVLRVFGDDARAARAGWPFLVGDASAGPHHDDVLRLMDGVGFRYAKDPRTGEYAHPAAVVLVAPDGTVTRYLYGTTFDSSDLKRALVEAGQGHVGSIVDRVILTCYHFDPATRRYTVYLLGVLRGGSFLILLAVAGFVAYWWRRDRRGRAATSFVSGSPQ